MLKWEQTSLCKTGSREDTLRSSAAPIRCRDSSPESQQGEDTRPRPSESDWAGTAEGTCTDGGAKA